MPGNPFGALRLNGSYRLFYLSFGFEGISEEASRSTLLLRILAYLHDCDRDGMPDFWEEAKGLNPLDPADAGKDSDGDGLTNLQEYGLGTDPVQSDTDVVKDAKVTSYSKNSITFLVPKVAPGSSEVKVLNGAGESEAVHFEVK